MFLIRKAYYLSIIINPGVSFPCCPICALTARTSKQTNIMPEPRHFSHGGITTSHLAVLRLLPGGVRMAEFLPGGIEYYPL